MKILLMGNPNVGKSVLFNRLTGANVIESNYPGTTVDYTKGYMHIGDKDIEVIDVPGTFSLEPKDKAEEVAVKMLEENKDAIVISVIDASKIERGLYLAFEVIERGYPVVLALNMWDIAESKKVHINMGELQKIIKIPVVSTTAISGRGIKELVLSIREAKSIEMGEIFEGINKTERLSSEERWDFIEKITKEVVTFGKYKYKLKDAIGEITVKPLTGIPIAIAILYGFWSVFGSFAGSLCTDGFLTKFFDGHWLPFMQKIFSSAPHWLYYLLVGDPKADNCFEAFGALTSGLYVPFGVVLPAIFIFYLMITLLEDAGYIPRLAVLVDTVLHKIGLHGFAIVPSILALGCNVPAVAATRVLETRKQRFMMMALLGVFIPCGAQIGIMQEVVPHYVGWIMLYLLIGYFVFGLVLNKVIPGKSPEILIDIPPYQIPTRRNVARKVKMRVGGFIKVAVPFVILGCILIGILYITGIMNWLAEVSAPVLTKWFGVPKETVGPLIAAFLRKDLAVSQLTAIKMTKYQLMTSVVLISIYFPCLATFAMMLKEGWKELLGALVVLAAASFVWGGLLHLIWILIGAA